MHTVCAEAHTLQDSTAVPYVSLTTRCTSATETPSDNEQAYVVGEEEGAEEGAVVGEKEGDNDGIEEGKLDNGEEVGPMAAEGEAEGAREAAEEGERPKKKSTNCAVALASALPPYTGSSYADPGQPCLLSD